MGNDAHFEQLETALLHEKRVVTYKWLSRKLMVDVNAAKSLLYDFYETPRPVTLHATYYLQGEPKEGGGLRCELAPQERLSEAKAAFKKYSVHMYSLQPCPLKDKNVLFSVDFEVAQNDTVETMRACRLIQNNEVEHRIQRQVAAASTNQRQPAAVKPETVSHSKIETAHKAPIKEVPQAPASKSSSAKTNLTRKGSSNADHSKSKASFFDGYEKKPAQPKEPTKPSRSATSASRAAALKKTGSATAVSQAEKIKGAEQRAALNKLMESDDDDEPDEEVEQLLQLAAEAAGVFKDDAMEETQQPDDALEVEPAADDVMEVDDVDKTKASDEGEERAHRRVKKRRRVRKTRQIKVGKYTKTEDYSDWEDYSESEPEPAPPPAKRPKHVPAPAAPEAGSSSLPQNGKGETKSAGGSKGPKKPAGQQKTLLSFFGKR
ncbi:DNA polymerase subunit Cdc27 [Powellomyces hirtus]|nr:DNA polymerase subunit Cdc27 [Powellomyces hirtus]